MGQTEVEAPPTCRTHAKGPACSRLLVVPPLMVGYRQKAGQVKGFSSVVVEFFAAEYHLRSRRMRDKKGPPLWGAAGARG